MRPPKLTILFESNNHSIKGTTVERRTHHICGIYSLQERVFAIWSICLLIGVIAGPHLQAQVMNVSGANSEPQPGTGHDYIGLLNETVDPATGSLSVKIGIDLPKGRGLNIPFSINYNSKLAYQIVDSGSAVRCSNTRYGRPTPIPRGPTRFLTFPRSITK